MDIGGCSITSAWDGCCGAIVVRAKMASDVWHGASRSRVRVVMMCTVAEVVV